VLLRRFGYFSIFMISVVAIWEGIQLLPTLLHGFVLVAVPAFLARSAAVVCLGSGVGLLPFVFRLANQRELEPAEAHDFSDQDDFEDLGTWESGV
jgi:hypothetical protein